MDFIKILRKQLVFPVKLTKPYPFIPPSSTHRISVEASSWHQERQCPLSKGADPCTLIPIPYSIYSYSSLRRACIQGLLRPVLVTRPTSTTSRGDQYCFLLVTSTGSIADQYWSQSPSSKSICNCLYTRSIHILDLGTSTALKRGLTMVSKTPRTF